MTNAVLWDIKLSSYFTGDILCLHYRVQPVNDLCNIWSFYGSDYEECRPLGYKNPVCTAQETHCVSTTESSLLMLYVSFEVFTAVTMKNVVFWDIKTQFVLHRRHITYPLQSSQLILCKIWSFHGDHYEECRLLGYKTQFVLHRGHITSLLHSPAG
jgi:hypothetical protein